MRRYHIKPIVLGLLILLVGTLACLFPSPARDWHQIKAYIHGPESLVNTNFPGLANLQAETRLWLKANPKLPPGRIINHVVLLHVKYTSDYENFHMLDYWAGPQETLSRGKEDCDGIAILEVSLARSLGYKCGFKVTYDHMEPDFHSGKAAWQPVSIILAGLRPSNLVDIAKDVSADIPGQVFLLVCIAIILPNITFRKT